jgi:hypothetical protein
MSRPNVGSQPGREDGSQRDGDDHAQTDEPKLTPPQPPKHRVPATERQLLDERLRRNAARFPEGNLRNDHPLLS